MTTRSSGLALQERKLAPAFHGAKCNRTREREALAVSGDCASMRCSFPIAIIIGVLLFSGDHGDRK